MANYFEMGAINYWMDSIGLSLDYPRIVSLDVYANLKVVAASNDVASFPAKLYRRITLAHKDFTLAVLAIGKTVVLYLPSIESIKFRRLAQ